MKKTKWGIIAAGGIALRRTIPVMDLCEYGEIVAVMDRNPAPLQYIKETYGIQATYTDEDEMLANPEVEAVYIASPVFCHLEQAKKVLKAGKHLLLEKPMGLDYKEAVELAEFVKDYPNLKVGIAMIMRMHPVHQKIRELVKDGVLGDVISARSQFVCDFPDIENDWRQKKVTGGGGTLVDMGVHCIDLLRYVLDDDVKQVYGDICTKTYHYEVDDSADCLLRMKKGATCFVEAHFNIPEETTTGILELYGTKASIVARGTIGQEGTGEVILTTKEGAEPITYNFKNVYAAQISAFSRAIMEDGEVSTTVEHALETARVVDALYRSAKEERVVKLQKGHLQDECVSNWMPSRRY